jgi:hypothetical protein
MPPNHVLNIGNAPLIDICPANLAVKIVCGVKAFDTLGASHTLGPLNASANMTFVFLSYVDADNFEL